jgi:hypothetical protein
MPLGSGSERKHSSTLAPSRQTPPTISPAYTSTVAARARVSSWSIKSNDTSASRSSSRSLALPCCPAQLCCRFSYVLVPSLKRRKRSEKISWIQDRYTDTQHTPHNRVSLTVIARNTRAQRITSHQLLRHSTVRIFLRTESIGTRCFLSGIAVASHIRPSKALSKDSSCKPGLQQKEQANTSYQQ